MTIDLRIAKKDDSEEWNRLVEKSPHGTIFHTWRWLKIAEKQTNSKLYPLIGYKGTTSIGVYPLFCLKKGIVKLVFSPPSKALLLYLGPALVDYDKLKQSKKESVFTDFQTEVDKFIASKLKGNYTRIRTSPGLLDSRPFGWAGYEVKPLYTYTIDLTEGIDHIWNELNREPRTNINTAQKEGVTVKEGFKEDLNFIDESLARRLGEQGSPRRCYITYLSDLYEAFHPQNLKVFVAKHEEENITGLVAVCYKDKTSLWIGTSKTSFLRGTPNDLLQWEAIRWACEHGFKYYEIMAAGDDPRLRHFKAKFNPELAIWFSAVKYSSPVFKVLEKTTRFVYNKFGLGGLT